MRHICTLMALIALTAAGPSRAANLLMDGPIDRGTNTIGWWCPSEKTLCGAVFTGAFTPPDSEITITVRARAHTSSAWFAQAIDNVAVAEMSVYDAHQITIGGPEEKDCLRGDPLEAFDFHTADSLGLLAYLETFDTASGSWYLADGAYFWADESAPTNLHEPYTSNTGGSLGLGAETDTSSFATSQLTIDGLTPGVPHVLSFWWKSTYDPDIEFCTDPDETILLVEVWGEDTWSDASAGPLSEQGITLGGSWGDMDDDGDPDLYVAQYVGENWLLRNDAGGFVALASPATGAATDSSYASAWGDYDGDTDVDLYVSSVGSDRLFRNEGDGEFIEISSPGVNAGGSLAVGWADYDGDLDLDAYTSGFATSRLLRNDGDGAFANVAAPPIALDDRSRDVAWGDYDDDGDPDLYIARHLGEPNRLFRNDDGTFVDVSSPPIDDVGSGAAAAWGDYDNDGDLDLFLANLGQPDRIFRNDGGTFADVTPAELAVGAQTFSLALGDTDNDGDLDLFLGRPLQNNKLYRNDAGDFVDSRAFGLEEGGIPYASAFADYDGDGDLDLFIAMHGQSRLFRNDDAGVGGWLHVDLAGVISNGSGIGARVRVVAGGTSQLREIPGSSGRAAQGDATAAFGLGTETIADTVEVTWPSGLVQTLTGVAAGQRIQLIEPVDFVDVSALAGVGDDGFALGSAWGDYDDDGDDDLFVTGFDVAGNHLYRNEGDGSFADVAEAAGVADVGSGRAAVWCDFDDDGDLDVLVSRYGPSRLYRNEGAGSFVDVADQAGIAHPESGEGAAFADYDLDGDLDLFQANSDGLNRFYRNEGDGTFVDAIARLPQGDFPSFGAAWADYDGDGDPDLFVAGIVPGTQTNLLFRNEGNGVFSDVTSVAGVSLPQHGRAPAWGDYDGDLDLDLFVTSSEEPPVLYRNEADGTFSDVTAASGVGTHPFPLHGAVWADFDLDGRLDLYAVESAGSNVYFHNAGGGLLEERTLFTGLRDPGGSIGAASADIDRDGDLDLFVANGSFTRNTLFRNETGNERHWLQVDLRGTTSNRFGVGARVFAAAGGQSWMREVAAGSGYYSSDALTVTFGLDTAAFVDSVTVAWPSGEVQVLHGTPADSRILFVEGGAVSTDQSTPELRPAHVHAPRPNPFRVATRLGFVLPGASDVRLGIYDVAGRLVRTVAEGTLVQGPHVVVWDGTDAHGRRVAPGVYFSRLEIDGRTHTRRLTSLR